MSNTAERPEPIEILLVEDSLGDIRLMREALRDARVSNRLHVVENGSDAMDFLRCRGRFSGASRPDLILLDLNLPRKDGREVLAEIKADEDLRLIPVIILTTSASEADILTSYDLHANCYLVKPVDIDRFFDLVRSLHGFWLTVVKYPAKDARSLAA